RQAAQRLIERMALPALAALKPIKATRAEIDKVIATLNEYRRRADAALTVPRAQRDPQLLKDYRPTVTKAIQDAIELWQLVLRVSTDADPITKELGFVKLLAWEAREIAGHERASITAILAAKTFMSAETLAANATRRAQVDVLWRQLELASGMGRAISDG